MRILVVSHDFPQPDQTSGDLRFFTLLSILAEGHAVSFYSRDQKSEPERDAAAANLARKGIQVENGTFGRLLRRTHFDVVIFELYFVAEDLLDLVRAWQPDARIVVDSVDVHFHRLRSKARLTGLPEDHVSAEKVCDREMTVYSKADLVIAVSQEDSQVLTREGLKSHVDVIPNIHDMHPLVPHIWTDRLELIFVGSYKWSPNIDAMTYFCRDVLPLVRRKVPRLRLRIVGSAPTNEVLALASEDVEVVGFVQETTSYLLSSDISIAPLRYGGGIKGKIGEAQAHGLPVVTTSIGAEGFGFQVGRDVLVGDTSETFSDAIVKLWQERSFYESVRNNGWNFINEHYSFQAISRLIPPILKRLETSTAKALPRIKRMKIIAPHYLDKHLLWRFRR